MHQKGRYKELLLMVETCQAATLYSRIKWVRLMTRLL
jgi:glycosylphosphatidylinositol transamidase (GPIT) subunit GPI8